MKIVKKKLYSILETPNQTAQKNYNSVDFTVSLSELQIPIVLGWS